MELLNLLERQEKISHNVAKIFAQLIAPLAPHLADELWHTLGEKGFVVESTWPTFDPSLLVSDTVTIAVQVNGKLRGQIEIATDATEDAVRSAAEVQENVKKHLEGKTLKKAIYVKGKLMSFVVA